MEIQIPPEEELTELAKRYGEDPRGKLKGTKKSGVTPVDLLPPAGPALSIESREICKLIEATQRKKLVGFTARELKAKGAFAYFESPKAKIYLHFIRSLEIGKVQTQRIEDITPCFPSAMEELVSGR